MSELITKHDNCAAIRWKLLTGASALTLAAYVSMIPAAKAEDADRPTLWIELGGELDQTQGLSSAFTVPFMTANSPTPAPYRDDVFDQSAPRFAGGIDGKLTFQPADSDWTFSAGIRYGRSHSNRHVHHQTPNAPFYFTFYFNYYHSSPQLQGTFPEQPLADVATPFKETHAILDFQAGKDVGLGLFGAQGTSHIDAGVRFAQFKSKSQLNIHARPEVNGDAVYESLYYGYIRLPFLFPNFYQYNMQGTATRSFRGVGPSLSWNGSAVLAGNQQDGELTFDLGVNAALLFGKQKAKVSHATKTFHAFETNSGGGVDGFHSHYDLVGSSAYSPTRSRSVTVPNIGGSIGLSVKYPSVKFSVGYRYDTFLNAMDTGIDRARKSDVTFNGPFASISIGIGD